MIEVNSYIKRAASVKASSAPVHKYMAKEHTSKEIVRFYTEDADGYLKELSPVMFKKSSLPDKTKEATKEWYADKFLPLRITQFNKKVDYNSWLKSGTRSLQDKFNKLSGMGVSNVYAN